MFTTSVLLGHARSCLLMMSRPRRLQRIYPSNTRELPMLLTLARLILTRMQTEVAGIIHQSSLRISKKSSTQLLAPMYAKPVIYQICLCQSHPMLKAPKNPSILRGLQQAMTVCKRNFPEKQVHESLSLTFHPQYHQNPQDDLNQDVFQ